MISEEVRKKISERTRLAMSNPQVRKKIRLGKLGKPSWNKGIKYTEEEKKKLNISGLILSAGWNKGIKRYWSSSTEFKIGQKAWNKGKKFPERSNENSPNWKGENVSFAGIHKWVNRHKGKPKFCEICHIESKYIHWSNIDHTYRRKLEDFRPLCPKCHKKYDLQNRLVFH